MEKNRGIFKELKDGISKNPGIGIASAWVLTMPFMGSIFVIGGLLAGTLSPDWIQIQDLLSIMVFLCSATLLMGLALLPTTLLAGLSGYLLDWYAFPILVMAYAMASLLGYFWGSAIGKESLVGFIEKFPKAKEVYDQGLSSSGKLIFFTRLSPVIPFAVSNLLFALMKTGWKKLVLFGTLGMLPRSIIAFLAGTIATNLTEAIRQEGIGGKGWFFLIFLIWSIWGIWKVLKPNT